jgi:hypothetical protein
MGGRSQRPNPEDYEAGPAEKMNAAVAKASNDYYVTKLQPLLIKQIQDAADLNVASTVRGYRQADVQQALNNQLDLSLTRDFQSTANSTMAAVKSTVDANTQALAAKREIQFGTLRAGSGLTSQSAGALATAARTEASTALEDAKSDLKVRLARADMKFKALQGGLKLATGNLASGSAALAVEGAGGMDSAGNPIKPSIFTRYRPNEDGTSFRASGMFGLS